LNLQCDIGAKDTKRGLSGAAEEAEERIGLPG